MMRALPLLTDEAYPKTRGDCAEGPRPCQRYACRHHLHNRRTRDEDTCSLDVADRGPTDQHEIADIFGITRARVGQIEKSGLAKLKRRLGPDMLDGWTHQREANGEESLAEVVDAEFKTAVERAYVRIVPSAERGNLAIRVKTPAARGEVES